MVEFVFRTTSDTLADRLVDGIEIDQEVFSGLAAQYVVAVAKLAGAQLGRPCWRTPSCPGVMLATREGTWVALVPDVDQKTTRSVIAQLASRVPADGWVACARSPAHGIAEAFREALDVVELLEAGRRPGGTYQMADVLVEYAVTREQEVADQLVSMIRPLRRHAVLWDTLVALVDADHNRNQAAKVLFVHRSTLNYRLSKIAEITGVDPLTTRGLQQLAIALVADAVHAPAAKHTA